MNCLGLEGVGFGVYGPGAAIERGKKQVGVWGLRLRVLGVGSPREPSNENIEAVQ